MYNLRLALLSRLLPRGKFARHVSILAGGAALGQLIAILAAPLLTRLYTPEDFGVLAVYTSILSLITVVASLRYELAIPIPASDRTAASLLVLSFVITLGVSGILGLLVLLLSDTIYTWNTTSSLAPYAWLIPLGTIAVGTYKVLNYWAIRKRSFELIARTRLTQGIGNTSIQIGMGVAQLGPMGLLIGQLVGQAAGITTLGRFLFRRDHQAISVVTLKDVSSAATSYSRFPLYSTLSGFLNTAGLQAPALILAATYGPQVAGWYALGQRVLGIPFNLVSASVAQVYLGEISKLATSNRPALHSLFTRTALRLLLIGAIPVIAIILGGPWLFEQIFGKDWNQAGLYLQLLALSLMARFVVSPLADTLNVLERQDLQLVWDAFRLFITFGTLTAAYKLDLPSVYAVGSYGVGMLIAYIALFCIVWSVVRVTHNRESTQTIISK